MSNRWPVTSQISSQNMAPVPAGPAYSVDWGDVLKVCLRKSWIILPVAVIGSVVAFGISALMPPVYEANAVLLLDRPNAGALGNAADMPPPNPMEKTSVVSNQITILRGSDVVSRVISQLHLASEPMFNENPSPISQFIEKAFSFVHLDGAQKAASARPSGDRFIPMYLDRLTTNQDPGTYIVRVGFRAPDPELATRVVNAEVSNYIAWSTQQQAQALKGAQSWLVASVDVAHEHVVSAEMAVQELNKSGVLLTSDGRTALDQGLSQLTGDLAAAQAKMVQAQANADELRRMQQSGQMAGIAAMSGSKLLQELQLQNAQSRAVSAAGDSNVGANNPLAYQSRARDGETQSAVARESSHFVDGEVSKANIAKAQVASITVALAQMKQDNAAAKGGLAKLSRLEGVAAVDRKNYLDLLAKLRSYDNVDQLAKADVTVLSDALIPAQPYSPRRGLFAMFGFLMAGAGAAGASVWRSGKRDVVRHSQDVETLTGIGCLGMMPTLDVRASRGIDRRSISYSFFREELRSICATLSLFGDRATGSVSSMSVMVTSSLPGEGKSTFCQELGRFAAESGVRTLIVRAELPTMSQRDRSARTEEPNRIADLPLFTVDWIAPATMLGGEGASEREMKAWYKEFGLVIIDTPPLSATAEGVILAPLADATIVLARADRTPGSLLAHVTHQLDKAGGRMAGLVLSFAHLDRQSGMVPSNPGYYFRQNRSYHQRLLAARPADRN